MWGRSLAGQRRKARARKEDIVGGEGEVAPDTQQKWKLLLMASKMKTAKKQGMLRIASLVVTVQGIMEARDGHSSTNAHGSHT